MSLKELINLAYKEKFAIGGFGVYNLESARAVVGAANATKKPCFLMMTEKSLDYAGFENLVEIVLRLKKESKTPVFLHLDHGSNVDVVKKCISSGFDSVMFDGSKLPIDQNIHISKDLRKIAHKKGVIYEAEIGQIGGQEDYRRSQVFKTNPSEALRFQGEVQPDILAVAIGNVHGELTAAEQLDFTLLGMIQDSVKAPLVLHGCSNRQEREYKVAISEGVVKINIDTELRQAFVEGINLAMRKREKDPREILNLASASISRRAKDKINIFSTSSL